MTNEAYDRVIASIPRILDEAFERERKIRTAMVDIEVKREALRRIRKERRDNCG